MPTPNVNDLNDAVRLSMQKMERYMLAKLAGNRDVAALEFINLDIAWDNYHSLIDMAPREVVEVHRAELPDLVVHQAAA